jgi:NTE family protein
MSATRQKDVALVLSGGGARGIAHIGVIEELQENGYIIRSVAGTSMGALIGGVFAKGNLPEFKEWLLSISKMEILKFLDLTTLKGGLVKGEKIVQAISHFIGDTRIEDLQIPFSAVAVDINNHCEVEYSRGNLMEAIRASISIPTVFTPVHKDSALLVDGGVLNPLPINRVKRHEGDILVAVNVNANLPFTPRPQNPDHADHEKGYQKVLEKLNDRWSGMIHNNKTKSKSSEKSVNLFEVIAESINLMQDMLMQNAIREYQPDILIQVSNRMSTIFDFYKADMIIEEGRKAARKVLKGSFDSKADPEILQINKSHQANI